MATLKAVKKYGTPGASVVKITIEMTLVDTSGEKMEQCDLADIAEGLCEDLSEFLDNTVDYLKITSATVTAVAVVPDTKKNK